MIGLTFHSPRRWILFCWAAAFLTGIGWLISLSQHPFPSQLWPSTSPDTLLYTHFIQKSSAGFFHGDPFLWEHREDSQSLFSIFHFWPMIYGKIFSAGGHPLLLLISTLLSGLWFYSAFRFSIRLGEPPAYAFFMSGLQVFFVVNLAYQVCGFKTNFGAYNLATTEHARLYPSVTAMAIYNLAALLVCGTLQSPSFFRILVASLTVALTIYGRPFDWMVLMGALTLIVLTGFWIKERSIILSGFSILIFSGLLTLPFIAEFLEFQKEHHVAYLDQIARGNLQVKASLHYIKYGLLCFILLGGMTWAYHRWNPEKKNGTNQHEGETRVLKRGLVWLCALSASSLLVHFKTVLDGGITLVGFTYLFVFSIAPWFFMLMSYFLWRVFEKTRPSVFESPIWMIFLAILLLIQQIAIGRDRIPSPSEASMREQRRIAYAQMKIHGSNQPVILTLGSCLEAGVFSDAWIFSPNVPVATYTCSAKTEELLIRFLLSKILLTGTLTDLKPLFSEQGIPRIHDWVTQQNDATRFWFGQLRSSLGSNTFIFHPQKNLLDLNYRKISLPISLREKTDFVCYFPESYRSIFQSISGLEGEPASTILDYIQRHYRLNWIHIPAPATKFIQKDRLTKCQKLVSVYLPENNSEEIWKVLPQSRDDSSIK